MPAPARIFSSFGKVNSRFLVEAGGSLVVPFEFRGNGWMDG